MSANKNRNIETIDLTNPDNSGVFEEHLDYFVMSLAIQNDTDAVATVTLNKYAEGTVTVPAGGYREFAVTTNYFYIEYTGELGEITVTLVKSASVEELLTPLFPNLYEQADTDGDTTEEDIKINPINAYGYTYMPFGVSDKALTSSDYNGALMKIEYFFDGEVVSTANNADFYADLKALVLDRIADLYPAGYTPTSNPDVSSATYHKITEGAARFFDGIGASLNDEFFGGYAGLSVAYDGDLANLTVALDAEGTDKVVLPWLSVNTTFDPGADVATVNYKALDADEWTELELEANTPQTVTGKVQYIQVTDGAVTVKFDGSHARMLDFAPIVNIVYPLGFTDDGGVPNESYTSFLQQVDAFKQTLVDNGFTGRVVYFRAMPFEAQPGEVYTADAILPTALQQEHKYVFEAVQEYVPNYHQYSALEEHIVLPIVHENWDYYHPGGDALTTYPTLEEIIDDGSVTVRGLSTKEAKRDFIIKLLIEEYTGSYSQGSMYSFTVGTERNRIVN